MAGLMMQMPKNSGIVLLGEIRTPHYRPAIVLLLLPMKLITVLQA